MKSYKNKYTFRLGTTSFILHAKKNNLIKNISFLQKRFDIIQLLFFGKEYLDEMMSPPLIDRIKNIKKEDCEFIIHLPIDFNLLNNDEETLKENIEIVKNIIDSTNSLKINKYILHIDNTDKSEIILNDDFKRHFINIIHCLKNKLGSDFSKIFIENTSYDLTCFKNTIADNNISVCMDLGHLIKNNFNIETFIETFKGRIKLIHIHGVLNHKDHYALDVYTEEEIAGYLKIVKQLNCDTIIEVFNKSDLKKSVNIFNKNIP